MAKSKNSKQKNNLPNQQQDRNESLNYNFPSTFSLKNEKQKQLINKIYENQIVFVSGVAGCGKTFIAIKAALEILKQKEKFGLSKILLTKPILEAGNEGNSALQIGALKGFLDEKISVYMHSFYANFHKLIGRFSTQKLTENNIIKASPLPYLRGETFDNSVVILDEGQNTTVSGMKLFLSRTGNSKIIVLGDCDQTDLKFRKGEKSGLEDALERFQGIKGVDFITFDEDDIVRSQILIDLMKRYKK